MNVNFSRANGLQIKTMLGSLPSLVTYTAGEPQISFTQNNLVPLIFQQPSNTYWELRRLIKSPSGSFSTCVTSFIWHQNSNQEQRERKMALFCGGQNRIGVCFRAVSDRGSHMFFSLNHSAKGTEAWRETASHKHVLADYYLPQGPEICPENT